VLPTEQDSYAFGIVLLELLVGLPVMDIVKPLYNDGEYIKSVWQLADTAAGPWPAKVTKGVAAVAQRCCELRVKDRATVRDVEPRLNALVKQHS
jgi:hypothetical protein